MRISRNLFFLLISPGLVACGESSSAAVDACVQRGVAYYQELGSYPTLSSAPNAGRLAVDVAQERCSRTTTAF